MAGTNIVGFQHLPLSGVTFDPDAFDPVHYFFPESKIEGNLFFLNYTRHLTLFGRTASLSAFAMGGNLDIEVFGETPGIGLKQSSHGFGDPAVQLTLNLVGAPALRSFYDMSKYEPKAVLDIAVLGSFPFGVYDESSLVNMGLNRLWTRVALPFTYHIGPYVPGYRTSVEIVPSVFLFGQNDDFVGSELDNDPLFQVEAHLTRDFTSMFFGSVDLVYRHGARSEIGGIEAEEVLDVLGAGFSLDFQATDNFGVRFSYHSLVGGDSDMDGDMFRVMGYFGWHPLVEKIKKLGGQ